MDASTLFLVRYDPLRRFHLDALWDRLNEDQLRRHPGPGLNSIAWHLWHVSRAVDVGINRFVAGRPQVLDDEQWLERLGLEVRHQGTGQTADEAAKISTSVNVAALREYTKRVEDRTREVLASVDDALLESTLEPATITRVVFHEGFAHSNAAWIEKAYAGWSRGKCLIHFA